MARRGSRSARSKRAMSCAEVPRDRRVLGRYVLDPRVQRRGRVTAPELQREELGEQVVVVGVHTFTSLRRGFGGGRRRGLALGAQRGDEHQELVAGQGREVREELLRRERRALLERVDLGAGLRAGEGRLALLSSSSAMLSTRAPPIPSDFEAT